MTNDTFYVALLLAAIVVLLGIAGWMDYQDAQAQDAHTCDMVEQGAWPAEYARSKGIECSDAGYTTWEIDI